MVGDHLLAESSDVLAPALQLRQPAGIDVDLVGRHDDVRDLRVTRPDGTLSEALGECTAGREEQCACENDARGFHYASIDGRERDNSNSLAPLAQKGAFA